MPVTDQCLALAGPNLSAAQQSTPRGQSPLRRSGLTTMIPTIPTITVLLTMLQGTTTTISTTTDDIITTERRD
jgi:hypothetical protein